MRKAHFTIHATSRRLKRLRVLRVFFLTVCHGKRRSGFILRSEPLRSIPRLFYFRFCDCFTRGKLLEMMGARRRKVPSQPAGPRPKEEGMRTIRVVFMVALACLLFAVGARAQMGGMMRPPSIQGVWSPVVGTGAAYEISDKKQTHTMEMTIVGKETVNGKDAYWMEYGIPDPKTGGMTYMKMLIAKDKDNVITERMIFQVPGQPQPMEMSMSMQMQPNQANSARRNQEADIRQKAQRVGTETITVPAGTFVCEHYRMTDGSGDVWFSPKVSPWGMVKFTGKETSLVLLKTITDAKDYITGTPVKFDPMQMMRQKPRQ
jgi:hypothetical protein